jgi:hypothetical protein
MVNDKSDCPMQKKKKQFVIEGVIKKNSTIVLTKKFFINDLK